MLPILIPAIIGALAGALRANHKDKNILGGAAKGALLGGSLGYGAGALGLLGGAGAGGAGAAGAGAGTAATGASSSGLAQYLPQIGSFLASNYSPSGAMSAYAPSAMADPWGGMPIQMLPSAMSGSIPVGQPMTSGASATGGLDQLIKMFAQGAGQGKGNDSKALGSPEWPRGVAGYGHGDQRKLEGLQMPDVKNPDLPLLIAMLSRMK